MHNIDDKEREEEMRARKRTLGIALKQARKAAGVKTQEDLSEKADIPLETIRSWEQGRKAPQLPQLLRLCEIYNCDLDYLVGRIKCKTHEIQDMQEYTGLSESALETLHTWKNSNHFALLPILSSLIENNLFGRVLAAVMDYFYACRKKETQPSENIIVIETGDLIPSAPDVTLWNATNKFTQCLKDVSGQK